MASRPSSPCRELPGNKKLALHFCLLELALHMKWLREISGISVLGLTLSFAVHYPAAADTLPVVGDLALTEVSPIRFGSMIVLETGRRTVTPAGSVMDEAVLSAPGAVPGPAQFTISYDRGNNGRQQLDLDLLVLLPGELRMESGTLSAKLQSIRADIPTSPGARQFVLRIAGCVTRVCSTSFRLGGTLEVTRSAGGGNLAIPVPVTVVLTNLARTDN